VNGAAITASLQHQNARSMRCVGIILDNLRGIDTSQQFLDENIVFRQFIIAMRGNAD